MKVCVLYSGGKDSNLALLKASRVFNVVCLVTLIPRSEECYLFHYPAVDLVELQAKALELPLVKELTPDEEKGGLVALKNVLMKAKKIYGVEGVVTGAIRSIYQASRFQKICWDLDLWCFNPLWLKDEISLLREMLAEGFKVVFTRVAGYPLKKSLVGSFLDENIVRFLEKIRQYVNPSGEGGEYETFVLDMPLFKKKIELLEYEVIGSDYDATLVVKKVRLVGK